MKKKRPAHVQSKSFAKGAPGATPSTAPTRAETARMACVAPGGDGVSTLLEVRAQPGAKRTGFVGFWNGLPKIAVAAPPENGRANAEIATRIAEMFGLRASAVELASGATSRVKRYRVACAPSVVEACLRALEAASNEAATRTSDHRVDAATTDAHKRKRA